MKKITIITILICLAALLSACVGKADEQSAAYELRLADRSEGYEWKLGQSGEGLVSYEITTEIDEDVRYWRTYKMNAEKAGDVTVTFEYLGEDRVMYTVTAYLTVTEDGQIIENELDGDIDEAMTT